MQDLLVVLFEHFLLNPRLTTVLSLPVEWVSALLLTGLALGLYGLAHQGLQNAFGRGSVRTVAFALAGLAILSLLAEGVDLVIYVTPMFLLARFSEGLFLGLAVRRLLARIKSALLGLCLSSPTDPEINAGLIYAGMSFFLSFYGLADTLKRNPALRGNRTALAGFTICLGACLLYLPYGGMLADGYRLAYPVGMVVGLVFGR